MSKREIIDYLTVDLKTACQNDILPAIQIGQSEGGYFSVPRLVLSCVDYLGALYCGWKSTECTRSGRPRFTASSKAIRYLEEIFGQVFGEYRVRGKLLWEIYRNGTVHLNEPKVLKNGANTIKWYLFKGNLTERMHVRTGIGQVSHLIPVPSPGHPNDWFLPVGISCLYQDLQDSLNKYADLIQTNPTLEDAFRSAMNEIVKPEPTNITWA